MTISDWIVISLAIACAPLLIAAIVLELSGNDK